MSTTRNILQANVGFDLTTGQYVVYALFSGTTKYWTGSAWTTTFASAQLPTFGTGTVAGASTWTWVIATAIDPGTTDDGRISMLGWESGTSPTIADPPTWVVHDEALFATETIVNAVPTTVTVTTNALQTTHLTMEQGEARAFVFVLEDADGNALSVLGDTIKLVVSSLEYVGQFQVTGTVGGLSNNQVTCSVTALQSASAASWQYRLLDSTTGGVLSKGAFEIFAGHLVVP